ncbi:MAG: PIN domain-containing protein [Actinomycetota bacterium]
MRDPAERGLSFVDTNVLVYAHDASEKEKGPLAQAILARLWQQRTGAISTQVLQEFYNVATRRFDPPMRRAEARNLVAAYGEWPVIGVDVALIVAASQLEERHTLSFWDALIVEAARRAGASRIVSEDLQAGRRFAGIQIVNPFQRKA